MDGASWFTQDATSDEIHPLNLVEAGLKDVSMVEFLRVDWMRVEELTHLLALRFESLGMRWIKLQEIEVELKCIMTSWEQEKLWFTDLEATKKYISGQSDLYLASLPLLACNLIVAELCLIKIWAVNFIAEI